MLTKQQRQDLALLNTEAASLTSKAKWSKQDEARIGYLKMAQAAVRDGMTLAELDAEQDEVRGNVNPTTRTGLNAKQVEEARMFKAIVEKRDVEGAPMTSHIGTYTGLSHFVPQSFFPRVFEALKAHDVLFDDAFCTQIRTENGRVMTLPTMSDVEHDASVISESSSQTEVDIYAPGQAELGVYSFASRRWQVSLEAFQDLTGAFAASELFRKFTTKALARGIGKALLTGNGSGTINGLLNSLIGIAPIVTAAGSAVNDGSANTGANSIGSTDLANVYADLDQAYLESPTTAWVMNAKTLGNLYGMVDKVGRPVINVVDGAPRIFNIPVKLSPSMPNIGVSNQPVLLGDLQYWATRLVLPGGENGLGITAYLESPGLVENGLVGFRSFVRAGGALLFNDTSAPSPFVILQNHS